MVEWHHQLDEHGFGWTPGAGDGQGGLACSGLSFSIPRDHPRPFDPLPPSSKPVTADGTLLKVHGHQGLLRAYVSNWVAELGTTEGLHCTALNWTYSQVPGLGHGQLLITKHASLGELHGKLKVLLPNNP